MATTLLDRINELVEKRHISIAELERETGISNGQIRRWDKSSPKAENLKKVADYFHVSTDYLLGRPEEKKDEQDLSIDEALGPIMSYDGKPVTDHDKLVMKSLLESYLKNKE